MEKKGKFVFYHLSSERRRRRRDEYDDGDSSWKRNTSEDDADMSIERGRRIEIVLNEDLLEEIMLNLPVKTLIRFQTVSKQWKRMITSKYFKERYMLHVKTKDPKFLSSYEDKPNWYKPIKYLNTVRLDWSSSSQEDVYEFGMVCKSLDGLVCVHDSFTFKRIKVVNPATRFSYKLPFADAQIYSCHDSSKNSSKLFPPGFGKDCITGTYKIVWLYYMQWDHVDLSCEVFDFGVKQWKHVDLSPLLDHRLKKEQSPTVANGWMYWLHQDKTKLIAFDLHMEVFKVIPNPIIEEASSSSIFKEIRIDSVDGHDFVWLSVATYKDCLQHVWKLTSHNTEGTLSIVEKIFSFDYYEITSVCFIPMLFSIKPITKDGNKFLLLGSNPNHPLIAQTLDSITSCHIFPFSSPDPLPIGDYPFPSPSFPSDYPLHPSKNALVPFYPSLISPF